MWLVFVGFLIFAFLVHNLWWIMAALALIGLWYGVRAVWRGWVSAQAGLAAERAAIVARCDQQHTWVLDGDPRGIYGADYAPLPH